MLLAGSCQASDLDCQRRHEQAHINGWPSWHPDAHYEDACGDIPMPPAEYDHTPVVQTFEMDLRFGLVDKRCRGAGIPAPLTDFLFKACSWRDGLGHGWMVLSL